MNNSTTNLPLMIKELTQKLKYILISAGGLVEFASRTNPSEFHEFSLYSQAIAQASTMTRLCEEASENRQADLATICVISRCIIDAKWLLFYLTDPAMSDEDNDFRQASIRYYGWHRSHELVCTVLSDEEFATVSATPHLDRNSRSSKLTKEYKEYFLRNSSFRKRYNNDKINNYIKKPTLPSFREIMQGNNRKLDPKWLSAHYDCLSAYVHGYTSILGPSTNFLHAASENLPMILKAQDLAIAHLSKMTLDFSAWASRKFRPKLLLDDAAHKRFDDFWNELCLESKSNTQAK